jgi:hypothetical protein
MFTLLGYKAVDFQFVGNFSIVWERNPNYNTTLTGNSDSLYDLSPVT